MEDTNVKLNEKEMTQSEFEEAKKNLEAKPDVTVVRVDENTYKTRVVG